MLRGKKYKIGKSERTVKNKVTSLEEKKSIFKG